MTYNILIYGLGQSNQAITNGFLRKEFRSLGLRYVIIRRNHSWISLEFKSQEDLNLYKLTSGLKEINKPDRYSEYVSHEFKNQKGYRHA